MELTLPRGRPGNAQVSVRSAKLAATTVAGGSTSTVYTCPAGTHTAIKWISLSGSGAGVATVAMRNGGAGTAILIAASGTATAAALLMLSCFAVLHSGDDVRVTAPVGVTVHVVLGGAELVL